MNRGRSLGAGSLRQRRLKNRSTWTLTWTDAQGQRRTKTLGPDRRLAERVRVEILSQRDAALCGLGQVEGQNRRLSEITALYLPDLAARTTQMHVINVELRLRRTIQNLRDPRVRDLTPLVAIQYRNQRLASGLAPRTANLEVDVVRSMLRWAVMAQVIAANPLQVIPRLRQGKGYERLRRRALSEDEVARLLAAAEAEDAELAQWWHVYRAVKSPVRVPQEPLIRTMLLTGARYGEVRRVTWGDLDLQRRVLRLRSEVTKSRAERHVPLSADHVDRLQRLRLVHQAVLGRIPAVGDLTFLAPQGTPLCRPSNNANRVFHRLLERARVQRTDETGRRVVLHSTRMTAASRLVRSGASLPVAQRILGHASPVTTASCYVDVEAADLRAAIDALPELGGAAHPARAKEAN